MGKPVATVGSQHICPMCKVPGVIVQGESNILINGKPVATIQSTCNCGAQIVTGTANILVNEKEIASVGDLTSHGSSIISGSPNVLIYTSKPTTVTPIEKIRFHKIGFTERLINSKGVKEFEKNKNMIKEIAKADNEKRIYNLKWSEEQLVIKDSRIIKEVVLEASTKNFEEGEKVRLTISNNKTDNESEIEIVTGIVKNNSVKITWEITEYNKNYEKNKIN